MKTENITFNDVPQAIEKLFCEVINIKQILLEKISQPTTDRWFDLQELCNYLPDKPAKATVYGMVSKGLIPNHKTQKKLRFLKSEIDTWLLEGKKKTVVEISEEVDNYLVTKHKTK